MSLHPRRGLAPLFLLLWLGLPAAAHALGGVDDAADFFKRETRNKAGDAIEEIRRRTHKDVLIETVNKLPREKLKEYRALKTEAERDRFIRALAEERARRSDVDGVYVLLCSVPAVGEDQPGLFKFVPRAFTELIPPKVVGHAVVVSPSAKDYFPEEDRAKLDGMFGELKAVDHKQDQVLLEAVKFAGDKLEANARALGAPPPDSFRWTDVLWGAAILAGAWAVLGVARARVAARQGAPGPAPGAGQGLTPLFGAAAGLWLFETYLTRRKEGASPPAPEPAAAEPAPPPEPDAIPPGGPIHPDDLEAITRGTDLRAPEDTEAATGHDLP